MSAGTFAVPIAPRSIPTFRVPVLSAWDLLPAGDPVIPTLCAWDLVAAADGAAMPSGAAVPPLISLASVRRLWRPIVVWPALVGLGLAIALARHAGAAEVPYLAHKGETLRQVAQRLWGEPGAWRSLWQLNRDRVRNPGYLPEGTQLRLPDQPGAPGPLPVNPVIVRPGDTLWDLSGRLYGDSWAWPVLWGANRHLIRDPHWIYPDQRFRWPSQGSLHVVQAGDTLRSLARQYYGSDGAWPLLWAANRGWLKRADPLPEGWRLWVPAAEPQP
jgi:nucleoid-associated protein YgaU